mgnify:CR=1 FL=1
MSKFQHASLVSTNWRSVLGQVAVFAIVLTVPLSIHAQPDRNPQATGVASGTAVRLPGGPNPNGRPGFPRRVPSDQALDVDVQIEVDPTHVDLAGNFYVVLGIDGTLFQQLSDGSFALWDGDLNSLVPAIESESLPLQQTITVFEDFVFSSYGIDSAEISVYLAYDTAEDPQEIFSPVDPVTITINDDVTESAIEPTLPEQHFNYASIDLPEHYLVSDPRARGPAQRAPAEFDNTPANNPITDAGATLGRVLFYDKKLSANGTIACASCHQQQHGFSDPNVLSTGFEGGLTGRHSMGLADARFYGSGRFFWDERADTLEEQVLMPFQDPVEMGLTLSELEQLVREQAYYPPLFEDAFGDSTINSVRISQALAQFVRSIVNTNSRYDQARAQVRTSADNFPAFTQQENRGKDLFFRPRNLQNGRASCAVCHSTDAFIGVAPNGRGNTDATNNGLDAFSVDDLGVFETSGIRNDIGKFKTPSLANIAVTAPYMHDGRFATLDEVIDHYSSGIQNHAQLSPPLRGPGGAAVRFNFSQDEKDALIAFLNTLTDLELLSDEKYSDPFQ